MNTELSWKLDANNKIVGLSIHDANLVRLNYVVKKDMEMHVKNNKGQLISMIFTEVKALRMDNFLERLIILDVLIWRFSSNTDGISDGWEHLYGILNKADVQTAALKVSLANPNSMLVLISSSYGGDISLVCNDLIVNVVEEPFTSRDISQQRVEKSYK